MGTRFDYKNSKSPGTSHSAEKVIRGGKKRSSSGRSRMEDQHKPWNAPDSRFGNLVVLGFLCVQCLDGVFTYLGIRTWGLGIEGNPIISSAVAHAGLGAGLAGTKLVAVAFGIVLHLRRIHGLVALLTAFYVAVAILPWVILLLN
jgi:hypothetical protein